MKVYQFIFITAAILMLMAVGTTLQGQSPEPPLVSTTTTTLPDLLPLPPQSPSSLPEELSVCPSVFAPECVPEWRNKACQEVMRKLAQQYPGCGFEVFEGPFRDFRVRGKIVDTTTGKGFKGIKIQALSHEVEGEYAETTTNEDGTFTLFVFKGAWQLFPTLEETSYRHVGDEVVVTAPQKEDAVATILLQLHLPVAGKIIHGPGVNPKTPYNVTFSRILDAQNHSSVASEDVYAFEVSASGGNFTTDGIPEGSYTVALWNEDPTILLPDQVILVVQRDKAKDGVVILPPFEIKRTADKIQGRVFNTRDKKGVKDIMVFSQSESARYALLETKTNEDGNFEFTVFPGPWVVWMDAGDRKDIMQGVDAAHVTVQPGTPVKIDFPVLTADVTVKGIVTLDGTTPLEDLSAYIEFRPGEEHPDLPALGVDVGKGKFSLLLPAATYDVWPYLPSGSEYALTTIQPLQELTLRRGTSEEVIVTVKKRDAIIEGMLKDPRGTVITNVPAKVYAEANGITEEAYIDPTSGRYQLRVYSGVYRTWNLSLSIGETQRILLADRNANYAQPVAANARVSQDFVLYEADSKISGKVFDSTGKLLSGITVTYAVDWWDAEGNPIDPRAPYFEGYTATGEEGGYELLLPAGTYRLSVQGEGLLSPDGQVIKISSPSPGRADFKFLPQEATLAGEVRLKGKGVLAWVSAWSDESASLNTYTDAEGRFVLRVSHGPWHLSAVATIGNKYYVSDEVVINTRENPSSKVVFDLRLEQEYHLPSPSIRTFEANQLVVVTLEDGTKITMPAGVVKESGKLTLVASPNVFLPVEADSRPIGLGYDLQVKDDRGRNIVKFISDVFVAIPYTSAQLELFGLTEDNLTPAYWDEKAQAWLPVKNVSIDREHGFVVIATNHFTKFALITHQSIKQVASIPPLAVRNVSPEKISEALKQVSGKSPTQGGRLFTVLVGLGTLTALAVGVFYLRKSRNKASIPPPLSQ